MSKLHKHVQPSNTTEIGIDAPFPDEDAFMKSSEEEITMTQAGDQDADDREIERMLSSFPSHLHNKLAARLVQSGVQDTQFSQRSFPSTQQWEHNGSRSPRREAV